VKDGNRCTPSTGDTKTIPSKINNQYEWASPARSQ